MICVFNGIPNLPLFTECMACDFLVGFDHFFMCMITKFRVTDLSLVRI